MTIAFLLQDTGAIYGAECATLELMRGLKASGVRVLALLIRESRLGLVSSSLEKALQDACLETISFSAGRRVSRLLMRQIRTVCNQRKVEILHTVGYKADVHGVWAAGGGRLLPVVSTVHGWLFRPRPKERFYQILDLFILRYFSRVIVLSHWYEQYLHRWGIPKTLHIPPGISANRLVLENDARALFADPAAPFTFGMLGRLSEEKNHELFLAAAKMQGEGPERKKVKCIIAGDGPLRSNLERKVLAMDLGGVFEFTGYLPSREFFRRTHVLIQCSKMDNQPYSVLEAMAWNRPVLATSVGGLPEMIVHEQSGFLIPPGNVDLLARRMTELAGHTPLCVRQGTIGRHLLEEKFSWERMLAQHTSLYQSFAEKVPV